LPKKIWKLGIIGWPLGYSLSPLMHRAALKTAGLSGDYKEIKVRATGLKKWMRTEALMLDGFNVTMPHKRAVASWLAASGELQVDAAAGAKGSAATRFCAESGATAVNTVVARDGVLVGYNTDGPGFLQPLAAAPRWGSLKGAKAVLLGAGGAAEGIAGALSNEVKVGRLTIWNRNPDRAEELVKRINRRRPEVAQTVKEIVALPLEDADLVVNATPMGMAGKEEIPAGVLDHLYTGQVVVDIVYEPRETALVRAARRKKCLVITGDEMLAAQGAMAFEIWTGVPAAQVLPAMKRALDEHFAARR